MTDIATPEQVRDSTLREAEANLVASLANSVTAVYGISGSGKSNLADTAAEYNWEVHGSTSLCYALDPGGFGTKRLALIKAGIMRVWRPNNHVNFFETMELISMGGFAETVLDPETGYADPNVRIVMPRSFRYLMICPQGHAGRVFNNEFELNSMGPVPQPCSECAVMYASGNCLKIERQLVRNKLFKNVGLRIYDSISAESDMGLILELPSMSAKGALPTNDKGGAALMSADALTSGTVQFGTGSMAQVGFMQNRAYGWLMNIGKIPDQKTPPVCIFGVEQSKDDDETGGLIVLGPRIAGRARTGAVPGWVGNCVHAVQEPDERGNMRFRLYLRTHVDPKDPRKIPYLAKHRGVPRDIPDMLEDPWDDDPKKRADLAWTRCSLNVLFRMIDAQVVTEVERLRAKYPTAPAFAGVAQDAAEDEVIETFAARTPQAPPGAAGGGAVPLGVPAAAAAPQMTVGGAAVATRRKGPAVAGVAAPAVVAPPVPVVATAPVAAPVVQPSAPTVSAAQGAASSTGAPVVPAVEPTAAPPIAVASAVPQQAAPAAVVSQPAAANASGPSDPRVTAPAVATHQPTAAVTTPSPAAAVDGPQPVMGAIARRRPRPPVG